MESIIYYMSIEENQLVLRNTGGHAVIGDAAVELLKRQLIGPNPVQLLTHE